MPGRGLWGTRPKSHSLQQGLAVTASLASSDLRALVFGGFMSKRTTRRH